MVQEGGSGASWGLPASRPAGLWLRSCLWELGGDKSMGVEALGVKHSAGTQQKAIPSCKGHRHRAASWRQP